MQQPMFFFTYFLHFCCEHDTRIYVL